MLSELCSELNNWFDRGQPKKSGSFHISGGLFTEDLGLQVGQYFRVIGSVFNDGVHQYTGSADEGLKDEAFSGSVWLMAVPKEVLDLAEKIGEWVVKNNDIALSPYTSENLSPTSYSYSLNTSAGGGSGASWENIFASELTKWRRIRPL